MDDDITNLASSRTENNQTSIFTEQAISLNQLISTHHDQLSLGSRQAWTEVFESVFEYCHNVVRIRINSSDLSTVEDVSTKALLRIREKYERYNPNKSGGLFTKWANVVIKNICNDHYRHQGQVEYLSINSISNLVDENQSLQKTVAQNHLNEIIYSLLNKLPPLHRDMWLDKHYFGKTAKEIAEHDKYPQKTVGAVNTKLSAIKKKLQEAATAQGITYPIDCKWEGI